MTVEDSFKTLDEEGKELNAIIYLREKNIGVQILRFGGLMQVCWLCIRSQKRERSTIDCRGD